MQYLFGDTLGLVHLISSIFALVAGTMVLLMEKGTKRHIVTGYVYVASMILLIITAFMIYRLFNGWGIFHYAAVASLLTLGAGMIPIWTRKPAIKWKYFHFSFMYWSVIGLYAAFASEILTRIPESPFFGMVGIATGIILITGGICFRMNRAKWAKIFGLNQ